MAKISVRQKKKIVAEYAAGSTFSALAKKYGVSRATVTKLCKNDTEFAQKIADVKNESEISMLEWVISRAKTAQEIVENILATFTPDEIKKMSGRDRAGLLKILIEQFTPKEPVDKSFDVLGELCEKIDAAAKEGGNGGK